MRQHMLDFANYKLFAQDSQVFSGHTQKMIDIIYIFLYNYYDKNENI